MTQNLEPKFNNRRQMIAELKDAGKSVPYNIAEYLLVHYYNIWCMPKRGEFIEESRTLGVNTSRLSNGKFKQYPNANKR